MLVSVTIVWQPQMRIRMHIAILCLKVKRNQICEQSLYVE